MAAVTAVVVTAAAAVAVAAVAAASAAVVAAGSVAAVAAGSFYDVGTGRVYGHYGGGGVRSPVLSIGRVREGCTPGSWQLPPPFPCRGARRSGAAPLWVSLGVAAGGLEPGSPRC